MRCFTHQGKEAVGICKACNKGICADCAADLGHSLACKSSCEEQAHLLDSAIQRSVVTIKATKRNRNLTPALFAVMGSVFIYYGIENYPRLGISLTLGFGFLAFAVIYYFVMRKWIRELDKKPAKSPSP